MATPPTFSAGAVLTAAQMNKVGLWSITPSAVSGTGTSLSGSKVVLTNATSVIITGIFSSDYVDTRIVAKNLVGSTTVQTLSYRLRTATTSDSSANYYTGGMYGTFAGTNAALNQNGTTSFYFCNVASGKRASVNLEVHNANDAVRTTAQLHAVTGADDTWILGQMHAVDTAYTSIEILVPAGNVSGEITIYGYNKG